jgi:hypothetical protein
MSARVSSATVEGTAARHHRAQPLAVSVARAFCDLLDNSGAVGQLVFLGTPHCGTDLGNPKKWGTLAGRAAST